MNKFTVFVLAVLLVFSFAGCTQPDHETMNPYAETPYIERPLTHFKMLEEIDAFAASSNAPDGFVPFEAISILGEFDDYMVFTSNFDQYLYSMVDQKHFLFSFDVRHKNFKVPDTLLQKTDSMEDMTTTGTDETGWILLDKLMYRYVGGELRYIAMNIDDVQVELSFVVDADNRIKNYPVDENGELTTFIERLVFGTEKEAIAAADEFIAYFRNNR